MNDKTKKTALFDPANEGLQRAMFDLVSKDPMKFLKSSYQIHEHFVAYIDILGIGQLIKDLDKNPDKYEEAYQAISTLQSLVKTTQKLRETDLGLFMDAALLSDTIVMSLLVVPGATDVFNLIGRVIATQRLLLKQGYLSRGAISHGHLHHSDAVIFGSALVNAYNGHQKLAIYPRVVIGGDATYELIRRSMHEFFMGKDVQKRDAEFWAPSVDKSLGHWLRKDNDGFWFVHYLEDEREPLLESRQVLIDHRTKANMEVQLEHLAKINWTINYFNSHISALRSSNPSLNVEQISDN